MAEAFMDDVYSIDRKFQKPHKTPMLFAIRQSTAHQVILFYSKVGMFFYPTKFFMAIEKYKQFTLVEFEKLQDSNLIDEKDYKRVCNVPTLFAFIVVAIPGVLLALILRFMVDEPKRGQYDELPATNPATNHSLWQTFLTIWRQPSLRWLLLGSAFASMAGYALGL